METPALIQNHRLELVEKAYQSFSRSKELESLISPLAGRKCLGELFDRLQECSLDIRKQSKEAMVRAFEDTLKDAPLLREDIAAQIAVIVTIRHALNAMLGQAPAVSKEEFSEIQTLFDFWLSAVTKKFQIFLQKRQKEDRKLIEELLTVKNDLQRQLNIIYQIIRETPIGIVDCDVNLRVSHWNPMATRLTGYATADILNQSVYQIFFPP